MEFQIGASENDRCRNVWVLTCGICRALEQTKSGAVLMEGAREDQTDKQGLYQRKRVHVKIRQINKGCIREKGYT